MKSSTVFLSSSCSSYWLLIMIALDTFDDRYILSGFLGAILGSGSLIMDMHGPYSSIYVNRVCVSRLLLARFTWKTVMSWPVLKKKEKKD